MTERADSSIAIRLRAFTPARVGLGATGVSLQTREVLDFQRAHALARDGVHAKLDVRALAASIGAVGGMSEVLCLHSAAHDRQVYLQRPDLGRALDEQGRQLLSARSAVDFDLVLSVADGLSALAIERHATSMLQALMPQLEGWSIGPLCIVEQGRVAIGDEIGELLAARMAVVLIGERPGLSSPDSLGIYVTWMPRRGRTDAERVCISNIRPEGLSYESAATQLHSVLVRAFRDQLTGVALRNNPPALDNGAHS